MQSTRKAMGACGLPRRVLRPSVPVVTSFYSLQGSGGAVNTVCATLENRKHRCALLARL